MPTDTNWEDGTANINILCDGCDKEYSIITEDTTGLELCPFCGHYLEYVVEDEEGDDETEDDSWY